MRFFPEVAEKLAIRFPKTAIPRNGSCASRDEIGNRCVGSRFLCRQRHNRARGACTQQSRRRHAAVHRHRNGREHLPECDSPVASARPSKATAIRQGWAGGFAIARWPNRCSTSMETSARKSRSRTWRRFASTKGTGNRRADPAADAQVAPAGSSQRAGDLLLVQRRAERQAARLRQRCPERTTSPRRCRPTTVHASSMAKRAA